MHARLWCKVHMRLRVHVPSLEGAYPTGTHLLYKALQ